MLTIVIPNRDRHTHLKECLKALVNQTMIPERVVISDWSADAEKTMDVAGCWEKDLNLKIISCPPEDYEINIARNRGREQVETPLMAVLDADIILPPEMLKRAVSAFMVSPSSPGAGNGNAELKPVILGATRMDMDQSGRAGRNPWTHMLVLGSFQMFRTPDFDRIGGYNPFMKGWGADDTDFVMRLEKIGCTKVILPDEYYHLWHHQQTDQNQESRNILIARNSWYDPVMGKWRMAEKKKSRMAILLGKILRLVRWM